MRCCGADNLCTSLPASIEGAVHTVQHVWDFVTNNEPDEDDNSDATNNDDAGGGKAPNGLGPAWPNLLMPGAGWANGGCADGCAHGASCATMTDVAALQTLGDALSNLTVTNSNANDNGNNRRNNINNIVDYEANDDAAHLGLGTAL